MFKWVGLGIAAVLVFLTVFFLGSKPAQEVVKGTQIMSSPQSEENPSTGSGQKQWSTPPAMTIDQNKTYTATITTSKGVIDLDLLVKEAPKTVNNFVFLAREKFYDGVIFHRIMKGFMVQTGDPRGTGTGGPGYKFEDEPVSREYVRGTVAMANAGPNTNGSQFFIVDKDAPLPKDYTIFGLIASSDTASLTTLDAIADTPVESGAMGEKSSPIEKVTIVSILIAEK